MTSTQHAIRFLRQPGSGAFRAHCSCGWSMTGPRDEVQARAATHDLDALELDTFKSGLQEDLR